MFAGLALPVPVDIDAVNHALSAMAEFHAGNLEAALAHARHGVALDPGFWVARYQLAQVYEQMGRMDLALEELSVGARLSNSNSKALSLRGYILAKAGRRREALGVLSTLEQMSGSRYMPPYAHALVHAGFGDGDATFEWLEKALTERDVYLVLLPVDPKWNPFRKDPRFENLLVRCGFAAGALPSGF